MLLCIRNHERFLQLDRVLCVYLVLLAQDFLQLWFLNRVMLFLHDKIFCTYVLQLKS